MTQKPSRAVGSSPKSEHLSKMAGQMADGLVMLTHAIPGPSRFIVFERFCVDR